MKRIIALCACFFLSTLPASAESVAATGPGARSCAEFGQLYKQNPAFWGSNFFSWAQGMMAGINAAMAMRNRPMTDLSTVPVKDLEQKLLMYCDQHPLRSYSEAVLEQYLIMRQSQGLPDPRI